MTSAPSLPPAWRLTPAGFADLDGWAADDHAAALAALRRSAAAAALKPPKTRMAGIDGGALAAAAADSLAVPPAEARAFFEARFRPLAVESEGAGLLTGYYEPEVAGSRLRTEAFTVPLYARPDDLVAVDDADRPPQLDPSLRFARRTAGGLAPYPDRAAIEAGFLAGRGLEIAFLADPVDAFFVHIQGSARIRLADGTVMRVGYDGKSGHPYTPIGRVLLERGALRRGAAGMAEIRAWLAAHPDEAPAVMRHNRSFIFFREQPEGDPALGPLAAAGVPLTPGRSLAVDRRLHAFHTPLWLASQLADGTPLNRLAIAQDTGSAIVGPVRGDLFFGSGEAAGRLAGPLQAPLRLFVLAPR